MFHSKLFLLALLILISQNIIAQENNYSRARIWFDGKSPIELSALGIDLSEGDFNPNKCFTSDFSGSEIIKIKNYGFRVEIIISDVQAYYVSRNQQNQNETRLSQTSTGCDVNKPVYAVPSHFRLGQMGGYYTYNEMLTIIDSMTLLFPNLISAKQPIGPINSIEGRPINYLKISDNPNVDESEPEVMYNSVHHAREPESMTSMIFYMWYLLENYSTDSTIQHLVDNTEMYFIPCVNPDGYIYNQSTNPNGGGMWRKNRRNNLDGTYGVDLNRNYDYVWGYDNVGSSISTHDETYRGTSAFSEPETQAMRDFINSRHFVNGLNIHTYGNHLIVPWGYIPDYYTPDSELFIAHGHEIARYNNYHVGTTNQTLLYLVNGDADAWMYGEQVTKGKMITMTPEIGSSTDGFWPTISHIIPLSQENMYANLTLARLAGRFGKATYSPKPYLAQTTNQLVFDFKLLGFDTTGNFTVSIVPLTSNIISVGNPVTFSGLGFMQSVKDSISLTLNPGISQAEEIKYALVVNNGYFYDTDTITQLYAHSTIAFSDDCNTLSNWNSGFTWGTTTEDFVSSPNSITDSPFDLYQPYTNDGVTLSSPINLTGMLDARLTFWAKWNIEPGLDYAQVSASTDNGNTWIPLCGKYTVLGTQQQDWLKPLYDKSQYTWVREEINLNDYIGQSILLSFSLHSNGTLEFDGFYFDDLNVNVIPINSNITNPSTSIYISSPLPNPATESASINFSNVPEGSSFQMYDCLGRLVYTLSLKEKSGVIQLPTGTFSNGLYNYFIRTTDLKNSASAKMIINRQ